VGPSSGQGEVVTKEILAGADRHSGPKRLRWISPVVSTAPGRWRVGRWRWRDRGVPCPVAALSRRRAGHVWYGTIFAVIVLWNIRRPSATASPSTCWARHDATAGVLLALVGSAMPAIVAGVVRRRVGEHRHGPVHDVRGASGGDLGAARATERRLPPNCRGDALRCRAVGRRRSGRSRGADARWRTSGSGRLRRPRAYLPISRSARRR
jgi:hypothetical protein